MIDRSHKTVTYVIGTNVALLLCCTAGCFAPNGTIKDDLLIPFLEEEDLELQANMLIRRGTVTSARTATRKAVRFVWYGDEAYIQNRLSEAETQYKNALHESDSTRAETDRLAAGWRLLICSIVLQDQPKQSAYLEQIFRDRVEKRLPTDWLAADCIAAWVMKRVSDSELTEQLEVLRPDQGKSVAWFLIGERRRAVGDLVGARNAYGNSSVAEKRGYPVSEGWGASWAGLRSRGLLRTTEPDNTTEDDLLIPFRVKDDARDLRSERQAEASMTTVTSARTATRKAVKSVWEGDESYINDRLGEAEIHYKDALREADTARAESDRLAASWRLLICSIVSKNQAMQDTYWEKVYRERVDKCLPDDWLASDWIAAWVMNKVGDSELIERLEGLRPGYGSGLAWFLVGERRCSKGDWANSNDAYWRSVRAEREGGQGYRPEGWGATWAALRLVQRPAWFSEQQGPSQTEDRAVPGNHRGYLDPQTSQPRPP